MQNPTIPTTPKDKQKPAEGLTTDIKESLRSKVLAIVEKGKYSGNRLAELSNVNKSYVSHIISGKYDSYDERGNRVPDAAWQRLANFLGMADSWVETRQYISLFNAYQEALEYGVNAIYDAITGVGKSATARYFRAMYPEQVFVISLKSDYRDKDLAIAFAEAMGLRDIPTRSVDIRRKCVARAKTKNTRLLFIVDEGEAAKSHTFGFLKNFLDELKEADVPAAMVLQGGSSMDAGTFGESIIKMIKANRPYVAQVFRRLGGTYHPLPAPTEDDLRDFVKSKGIFDKACQRTLARHCKEYGTAKSLVERLMLELRNANLTLDQLDNTTLLTLLRLS